MPRTKAGIPKAPRSAATQGPSGESGPSPASPRRGGALGSQGRFTIVEGMRFKAELGAIAINPRNLREEWEFEAQEFRDFEGNLKSVGEIQDVVVARLSTYLEKHPEHADTFEERHEYVLLAGERRYRAAVNRGETELAVVLRDELVAQGDFGFLSENHYRKPFDPIQEGTLYKRLQDEEGLTYSQIIERLGSAAGDRKVSDISKRVRLAEGLTGDARKAVRTGELKVEPAYLLLTQLKDPEKVNEALQRMREEKISASELVNRLKAANSQSTTNENSLPDTSANESIDPSSRGPAGLETERSSTNEAGATIQGPNPPSGDSPTEQEVKPLSTDRTGPATGPSPRTRRGKPIPPQGRAPSPSGSTDQSVSPDGSSAREEQAPEAPDGETLARDVARKSLLMARANGRPDTARLRFAAHIMYEATEAETDKACKLLDYSGDVANLSQRLLKQGEEEDLLLFAEALVLLADDYHLDAARAQGTLTHRATTYLADLRAEGDYEPDPAEPTATEAVS